MTEGSYWFRRFVKECKKMSRHIEFVPITHGYYRIYWTGGGESAYTHEVYKWMPYRGHEIEFRDLELVSQRYYEEYEDQLELTRKMKNYVEGYVDAMKTLKTRVYQFKHSTEYWKQAVQGYRQMKVK